MKIVSSIVSLFLIAIILFNSLRVSLTYTYYAVDTIGFIERLCENKDEPILQCNGKCHLKKVAQKNTANNDNLPLKEIDFKEVILFVVKHTAFNFTNTTFRKNEIKSYNSLYTYSLISTLYHPPEFSLSHLKIKNPEA